MLTQVMGTKRMLFFSPKDLDRLMPFPSDHMLARRCRSILCHPPSHTATDSTTHSQAQSLLSKADGDMDTGRVGGVPGEEDVPGSMCSAACGGGESSLEGLEVREVELQAGDVVVFGPYWPHWTVSETVSASVTLRVGAL